MAEKIIHNERILIIMALIPIWPVQLYSFYMIEKTRKYGLILLGILAISITCQMVLPFPYGLAVALPITIAIPGYYMKKWVRQWNAKLNSS
ncbi:hypothetical protein [Nitrosopumilus adriaticus]|uniref:Uncharacterized protein n=1 Tax=Nitrosopumilus adriaticus TaxID=1580092 RepID=A0A0D5C4K7_9ARCH|nr:hypothetical protein [Nitrosopumilus adriaticus]AJW71754.1 membrane protein of unknown function [Nitrosopumilus adriaticus]